MVAPGFPSKIKAAVVLLLALLAFSIASTQPTDAATPSQEYPVADTSSDQLSPAVGANKIVVWEDPRNGAANVYGKDLSTGVEFQVTSGATPTTKPQIAGETMVWESQYQGAINYGNYDILGTDLDTAPGAPKRESHRHDHWG